MFQRIFKLFALLIGLGSLTAGWFWNEYNVFLQTKINKGPHQTFTIEKGMSIKRIAHKLYEHQIIAHPFYFAWHARLSGKDQKIKAGEYLLTEHLTSSGLLDLFVLGKVNQYSFTLVEGWNFKQLMQKLQKSEHLRHYLTGLSQQDVVKKLNIKENHPEGLFYPDTYHFPKGTSDIDFLMRAKKSMDSILNREWQNRDKDLPLKNPYEALILASIVEKESGLKSERDKIAGVFIRRIRKKMRLQSDPTIIYGMGDSYKGNIRRKDINKKTAYNTYQIDGLPPTPIAMPGQDAIHAVLHPAAGKVLYFVADGSGGHVFSKTLKEHNRAVKKYILKR